MTPAGPLVLSDPRLDRDGNVVTLSGSVDEHRIFWAMPERPSIELRGEPFVAATLISAMRTGRDLVLPASTPVDATFLKNVAALQPIFARWFPGLRVATISAAAIAPRSGATGRFTGYSGGVDSSFTVMQLSDHLDGAALFDGIEYGEPNPTLMSEVDATLRHTMAARGLPLLTVQTNAKTVGKRLGGRWSQFIGGTLASLPHALGVAEYAIAGSNSWENARPYGTHPFTDPLWSSADVAISHHGADYRRIDKIAALAKAPDLLAALRVCFQGDGYNCGKCQKCVQTSAAMRAVGVRSDAIPPLNEPRLLRRLTVEHDGDLVDWAEIVSPELVRSDPQLARELGKLIRRYQVRQLGRRADEVLLGGFVRRLMRRK